MFDHMHLKHKENPTETDNRQPHHITANPVSTRCFDDARAEKVSLLITKMVTGDLLQLSFAEGGFCKRMAFVDLKCKPASGRNTVTKVETIVNMIYLIIRLV